MSRQHCPVCAEEVVSPVGRADAEFLAIEEYPHMIFNPPLQGNDIPPSKIFRREVAKAGLNIAQFRIVSVYPHVLDGEDMDERCWKVGNEMFLEELYKFGKINNDDVRDWRGILVFGSTLCSQFTGDNYKLDGVVGLTGVPHYLQTNAPVMFLPSIKTVYSQGAGELQLGLKRFADLVGVEDE